MMIYYHNTFAVRAIALATVLAGTTCGVANAAGHIGKSSNSYWTVYDGDAPSECVVDDGLMVDDTCCTRNGTGPLFGLIVDAFKSNCFVIPGLLGEGGGSLQSYLGCDETMDMSDMSGNSSMSMSMGSMIKVPFYGEGCYNNGINGGIIPDNVTVADTNATDIGECGCTFMVSGNGCHKIRDFSSLPGFENDTRQVFLYMDETCEEMMMDDDDKNETSTDSMDTNETSADMMNGTSSDGDMMMDDGEEGTCGFGNVGNGKCFNPSLCCYSDGHCDGSADECDPDSSSAASPVLGMVLATVTAVVAAIGCPTAAAI